MKLREICAHGFDNLCNASMRDIAPGLVIIEGENGAGKTTLFRFIRSLIEGGKTTHNEPLRGGKHGGEAVLEIGGQAYRITRTFSPKKTTQMERLDTGEAADPATLLPREGSQIFTDIFTITLDELLSGSEKVQGRVDAALSGTGVLGLAASLAAARDEREALFLPKGQKSINQAITRWKEATDRVTAHRGDDAEYRRLGEALDAARTAEAEAQCTAAGAAGSYERARRRAEAWPVLVELRRLDAELAAMPPGPALPSEPLEELARRHQGVHTAKDALEKLRTEAAELEAQPGTGSTLHAEADNLAGLQQRVAVCEAAQSRSEAHPERIRKLLAEANVARGLLGEVGDPDQVPAIDTLARHLKSAKDRLTEARADQKRSADALDTAAKAQDAAAQALADAENAHRTAWPEPPADIEALRKAFYDWRDKVRNADSKRNEAKAIAEANVQAAAGGRGAALAFALALAFGLPMGITFHFLLPPFGGVLGLAGAVLGILLARALAGRFTDPTASSRHAAATEAAARAEGEARAVGAAYGWKPEDLVAAETSLNVANERHRAYAESLAKLEPLRTAQEAAKQAFERAQRTHGTNLDEAQRAYERWLERLASLHLPPFDPNGIDEWLETLKQVREADAAVATAEAEHARDQAILTAFRSDLEAILGRLGRPINPEANPFEILATLNRELAEELTAAGAAKERALRLGTLVEQAIPDAEASVTAAERAVDDLLRLTEEGTEEAFVALVEREAARLSVVAEREATNQKLAGTCPDGTALEPWLDEVAQHGEGVPDDSAILEAEAKRDAAVREVARLETERKNLREDTKREQALLELAQTEASLAEGVERYVEATVRWALLEQARREFESKHETPVIRRASEFLNHLTGGDCPAIQLVTDLKRNKPERNLRVLDRHQQPRTEDQLNRSLRERALLAIRLGYIEQYAADNEGLPIVLDDVFVNFDPRHTDLAAETFLRLSERHQVLYMTCHPQTHAVFRAAAERTGIPFQSWKLEDYLFLPHRAE